MAVLAAVGLPEAEESGSAVRPFQVPFGLLVLPFMLGLLLILAIGWVIERQITMQWIVLGIIVGVVGGILAVVGAVRRQTSPRRQREAGGRGESPRKQRDADPLGHIQAAEEEHRRYRRPCLNCGEPVSVARGECPHCGHRQVHACKTCGTPVRLEWNNCPECGTEFHV